MSGFSLFDAESSTALAKLLRPPRDPMTFLEFCHTMRLPDGEHEGKYFRPETEPAQKFFSAAVDSGRYNRFVNVAPSQRGKTTITVLAPTLHSIAEEGLAVGYIMPNLDKISQVWIGKIAPAIAKSGFSKWLPTKGPGSEGGRPAALAMTNPLSGKVVILYFMAAGTGARQTALASVSPARVVIDEADDFEDAGQLELAMKRLSHWGPKGRAFIASTVNARGDREGHPILDFYARSDATQTRLAHRCPHCGAYQVIQFEQLDLNDGRVACAKCGVKWTEDERHQALDDSVEQSANPNAKTYYSLLTTAFDYHMGDFSEIAPAYLEARERERLGDYSLMETFQHKVLCRPYTIPVDHETVTDRMLTLRAAQSPYDKGVVPDDVERIVVGVDVQGDRCYWVAVGSGPRNRRWIIDYDEWFWSAKDAHTGRPVEPTDADRHAVLDRIVAKARDGWAHTDGSILRASLLAIDIGFNPGGSIGRWCAGKAGIVAVRGDHENRVVAETLQGKVNTSLGKHNSMLVADHGMYEIRKQEAQPGQPGVWWFVKSQTMREHTMARLRLPYDADGSTMLPHGVAEKDYLIQHLSSWAIVREPDSKIARWVQVRKRDDYLDAMNYATALLSQTPTRRPTGGTITAKE